MSKKAIEVKVQKRKPAAQEIESAQALQEAFEVRDEALRVQKVDEIGKLLWFHAEASEDAKCQRIVRAVELYESLEPADGAEGMLAMQMVGAHDSALECLKRAAISNQTFAGRDTTLKHAQKLMALYVQQLAALDKRRGKGQQKVTVEYVNVEAGGQAIVGNVEAGAAKQVRKPRKPRAIAQKDMLDLDADPIPESVPESVRKDKD